MYYILHKHKVKYNFLLSGAHEFLQINHINGVLKYCILFFWEYKSKKQYYTYILTYMRIVIKNAKTQAWKYSLPHQLRQLLSYYQQNTDTVSTYATQLTNSLTNSLHFCVGFNLNKI